MSDPSAEDETAPARPALRLGGHALRGSAWLLLSQAVAAPLGLGLLYYLTQRFGAPVYGRYAVVMAVLSWVDFGVGSLLVRSVNKRVAEAGDPHAAAAAALRLAAGLGLTAALLFYAAADPVARALGDPTLAGPLRLAACEIPLFMLARCYLAVLTGWSAFGRRAVVSSFYWPVRLVAAVVLIESGWGVEGAIVAAIVASGVELAAAAIARPVRFWTRGRLGAAPPGWWMTDVLPLFGSALALRLTEGGDLLLLRALGAEANDVGGYAAAMNIAILPGLVASALFPGLLTLMVRLRRAGHERAVGRGGRAVLRGLAWTVPPTLTAAALAHPLALSTLGPDYAAAGGVLGLLLIAGVARLAIALCAAMLAGAGRSWWAFWAAAPCFPVALAGYLLLIPRYGAAGAAWATLAATLLSVAASLILLGVRFHVWVPRGALLRVAGLTALTAGPLALEWAAPAGAWAWLWLGGASALCGLTAWAAGDLRPVPASR